MFSHIMLGTDDVAAAKRFYDATLGALGLSPGTVDPRGRLFFLTETSRFIVTKPINGEPASFANGGTIAFNAKSTEDVDAWHSAGVANGGTSCEDPPGVRGSGGAVSIYVAYLRDPAGNKLCAICRTPA